MEKLVAESMHEISALKDLLRKLTWSAERYAAVEKLIANHGVSKRHACRLIGVSDLNGNIRHYAGGMTRFA